MKFSTILESALDSFCKKVRKFKVKSYKEGKKVKFILKYSGGKDSTLIVLMALYCIKNKGLLASDFKVINCDTLMEYPSIYAGIEEFRKQLPDDLEYISLTSAPDKGFFYDTFARGKVISNPHVRNCTQKLKITPSDVFLRTLSKKYKVIKVMGVHFGESTARDNRLSKTSCGIGSNDCGEVENSSETMLQPIINFKSCQVWDSIRELEFALDFDIYSHLMDSYTIINSEIKGDNLDASLRTGCIGCPVISVVNHYNSEKKGIPTKLSLKLALIYQEMMRDELRMISPKSLDSNNKLIYKENKKGKKYHLFGAYPVEVRRHYWGILKPILLEIREASGVPMITEKEIELIENSFESPIYPGGHTEENIPWLYAEWLSRKPIWIV